MSYTNDIIRDIADVANPETPRKLAIADSQKSDVALTTLAITAGELGLDTQIVDGVGEDGEVNRFLIVAPTKEDVLGWAMELLLVGSGYAAGSRRRKRLQGDMGLALGYSHDSIREFLKSDLASECPCTCCGGNPQ